MTDNRPCLGCGESTVATYRLCEACLASRTSEERVAQGLPAKIDDPLFYDKAVTLVRATNAAAESEAS